MNMLKVVSLLMLVSTAESRMLVSYPGLPQQLVEMLLGYQVPNNDGTSTSVMEWVTYFGEFSQREWAEYAAEHFNVNGLTFSMEEWENHWTTEVQDRPERAYALNWILPFLRLHD